MQKYSFRLLAVMALFGAQAALATAAVTASPTPSPTQAPPNGKNCDAGKCVPSYLDGDRCASNADCGYLFCNQSGVCQYQAYAITGSGASTNSANIAQMNKTPYSVKACEGKSEGSSCKPLDAPTNSSHRACVGSVPGTYQCKTVDGPGSSTCDSDATCNEHEYRWSNSNPSCCILVSKKNPDAPRSDQCSPSEPCKPNPSPTSSR